MYSLHISKAKKFNLKHRKIYSMVGTGGIKSERMSFSIVDIPPKTKLEPHKHIDNEEIIYIIEGFGKVYIDSGINTVEDIEVGTVIVVPKNADHFIENESKNVMRWCGCLSPPINLENIAKV